MEFPWPEFPCPHWAFPGTAVQCCSKLHQGEKSPQLWPWMDSSRVLTCKIAIVKRNRHCQKEYWYRQGVGEWTLILNVMEHAYHKNGDQFISKLSIVTLRKIEFKIAFTDTFISASKAREISKEMYLSIFPANVSVGWHHRQDLE